MADFFENPKIGFLRIRILWVDSHSPRLKMKLKQLESLLGDLEQFSNPKVPCSLEHFMNDSNALGEALIIFVLLQVELEQYPTGPHIAARMLYTVIITLWLVVGLNFRSMNDMFLYGAGGEFFWGCYQ